MTQALELEEATAKSDVGIIPASDIIDALQNILEHSQFVIPDLETPYSKSPNPDQYQASQLKGQSIDAILTEREDQLNAVLRNIPVLDTIVDKIKNLRQQLVEEQHKIVHSMNLHRGYRSALWRLPVEVLSQNFVHCLPKTDYWSISPMEGPMLLTNICRRWREVVVNMPSLWCRLTVGGLTKAQRKTTFCYDSWLKRSRQRPLSLRIYYVPKDITMIHTLLQSYANQISSLDIIFHYKPEHVLLPNLPALQELTLYCCISYDFIGSFSCPRLRNFKLKVFVADPINIKWSSCDVWAHLTNLEITVQQPRQFLHLLNRCPNLSSFAICLFRGADMQPFESLTHTNLQSLSISCYKAAEQSLPALLDALTLPNLRVFDALYIPSHHEALKALLTRSNFALERLIFFAGVEMTDEHRAEYLAFIPSLEIELLR
ncbi:hypothetical protein K503DRAFT_719457 [Rhizopogon vinicolor AM-OR11-026]|uniref:Uncharacterized protein n=1 Tax=Rhizopogon vinicolor AM-OR11-026 TaxID=1314800 RepID=A0A1B7MYI0_9AGAM|nr:hypothetical protein K503DRAFT_719457 [Rhizopogon vinicolor AM-OR11-026]